MGRQKELEDTCGEEDDILNDHLRLNNFEREIASYKTIQSKCGGRHLCVTKCNLKALCAINNTKAYNITDPTVVKLCDLSILRDVDKILHGEFFLKDIFSSYLANALHRILVSSKVHVQASIVEKPKSSEEKVFDMVPVMLCKTTLRFSIVGMQ